MKENNKSQKWFRKYTSKYGRNHYIANIFLGIIQTLLLILQVILFAKIIDNACFSKLGIQQILFPSIVYILLIVILRSIIAYLKSYTSLQYAQIIKTKLRKNILDYINNNYTQQSINTATPAKITTVIIDQIEQCHGYFANFKPVIMLSILNSLIIGFTVLSYSYICGAILLICIPLMPIFMALVGWRAQEEQQKNFESLSKLSYIFVDLIRGLSMLKLMGRSKEQTSILEKLSDDYRLKTMKVLKIAFLSTATIEFFAAGSIAVLAIYLGAGYLNSGMDNHWWSTASIGLYGGLIILMLAPEFFSPFREISVNYHTKAQMQVAAKSLYEMMHSHENQISLDNSNNSAISTSNLIIKYDHTNLQLENISINQGEKTAIVGESGKGKTSLILAMLQQINYDGTIYYYSSNNSFPKISYCEQMPQLIPDTIRYNLVFDNNIDDNHILEILKKVNMYDLINSLEYGLDTLVGDNNFGFSGGQIQRLSIARMLLKDADIFIMDEPFASLDDSNTKLIIQSFIELLNDKTVVISTHKEIENRFFDTVIRL